MNMRNVKMIERTGLGHQLHVEDRGKGMSGMMSEILPAEQRVDIY